LLRGAYHGLLIRLPWLYAGLFAIGCRFAGAGPITRTLLRPVRPRMRRFLPSDVRAVVSIYPTVSQLLGPLRRDGHLAVPVITYLTDFGVHPIWVSPGVDVYCRRTRGVACRPWPMAHATSGWPAGWHPPGAVPLQPWQGGGRANTSACHRERGSRCS
jgi:hypothetical protein